MDNKELNEILQEYAESTRTEQDIAFKKLNEKPVPEKKANKKFKWQYMLATVASVIAIVLCIVLPITLTDTPQPNEPDNAPTYCDDSDIIYNEVENITVLQKEYGINAFYLTYEVMPELISTHLITLQNDIAFNGAEINLFVLEEIVANVKFVIIPKAYILQDYETYFTLPNNEQWRNYAIKYNNTVNTDDDSYEVQIYFSDDKYDYFISASSDEELNATELLNVLYV